MDTNNRLLESRKKYLTLIIYDISQTKMRNRLIKILKKYGLRVQKSAFEAFLNETKYKKMVKLLEKLPISSYNDTIRIYRLKGVSEVYCIGHNVETEQEDASFF